jgi:DNA-binding Lrp family transcriptional regulator
MLKKILKILEEDSRTTPEQIATMLGISRDEVVSTVKKAEDEGKILKYKTLINWDKVNDEHVWALIEVQVSPQRDTGYDAIAEKIYRFPQARSVYLMSGAYDLAVLVMGKSMHEVADFVGQKLSPIEGVRAAATHFIMKRYKEDGVIMNGPEEIKRQPVIL